MNCYVLNSINPYYTLQANGNLENQYFAFLAETGKQTFSQIF